MNVVEERAALAAERTRLDAEFQEGQERFRRDSAFLSICKTPVPGFGYAKNCEANKSVIESWINLDEEMGVAWFAKILTPGLARQLIWDSLDTRDPVKRKQAEVQRSAQDTSTFLAACREFSISQNEANFKLILEVLDSGFSTYEVGEAIASGAVRVSPATPAEVEQWAVEKFKAADTKTQIQMRHDAALQVEADRQLQAKKAAFENTGIQYPPLPASITKQVYIAATREQRRTWNQKYGTLQIDARLQGRG